MILVSIVLFIVYYPVSYTLGSGSAVTVALVRVSRYTMLWFCPNATSRAWKPATTVDGIAFPPTLRCDTRKRNRNRWMNRWQKRTWGLQGKHASWPRDSAAGYLAVHCDAHCIVREQSEARRAIWRA